MDIWVRSQDRSVLSKIDGIYIKGRHYAGGYCYDLLVADTGRITLGTFKSYANALQVIGDFQEHAIETQREFLFNIARSCASTPVNYEVFQIPEDKNV